ncbi:MAG: PIG-L family deacetylase [Chitinophagaceae bacterium]|nr:MAG: PIG-L family deacetylase [Chitinophagaceae bacterium]
MRKIASFLLPLLFLELFAFAQQNPEWEAAKIKLRLEKLNTIGRVLYIAAHPDDENTGLLSYLSNEKKYRTAYLSLTRGDGGQNLVGDEQGQYLGLMRTEEQLAARHIDGAEEFFSHALDFGFSKTAVETFQFWGHQRILADVVWIIRKFRPDVIICRFPADKRAGHGNHWASAILAHEAFNEAGDPTKFPEQLKYVKPWQAKRILWNTYHFGSMNTTSPDQFRINTGVYYPLLGIGNGELAAESRSMNKTQGFGVSPDYGDRWEYFETIAGTKPEHSLMDGVNTSWSGVTGSDEVQTLINEAMHQYKTDDPGSIVPVLLEIRSAIGKIADTSLRNYKLKETDQLILACSGILLNAYAAQPYIVAGQDLEVQTQAINRSNIRITLESVDISGKNEEGKETLEYNVLMTKTYNATVPGTTPISQPYWLIEKHPAGYYKIPDQRLVGLPENPPVLTATFHLKIDGQPLSISRRIVYKHTDPVRGQILDPLVVTPPVTANVQNGVYIFTSLSPQQIEITLKSYRDQVKGTAHIQAPSQFSVENNDQSFDLQHTGDEAVMHFTVVPADPVTSSVSDTLTVHLKVDGKDYDRGIRIISPGYIPTITVFPFATTKLVAVPLKLSGKNRSIGYIIGAGDKVPQALEQMGYRVKMLSDNDLSNGDLRQYDAIVVGIRAYNTRNSLKYVQPRLLNYVKEGGTLLVQYNKNFGLVTDNLGPYPFEVTTHRITDETSPVNFLLPDDPILNFPNKISKNDFNGWVQERGVYFVENADPHYRKPLSMQDPDEVALDGGLIVCDYGKGKYVYSGLDFFRELPAGVPGAFRLFANLIAGKE